MLNNFISQSKSWLGSQQANAYSLTEHQNDSRIKKKGHEHFLSHAFNSISQKQSYN